MAEAIQVLERRFGLVPSKINRQGQVLRIDAVEQCWTEMKRRSGEVFYHYLVRCGPERYRLSEDANSGDWTMQVE